MKEDVMLEAFFAWAFSPQYAGEMAVTVFITMTLLLVVWWLNR
jgi:hypothetical protein